MIIEKFNHCNDFASNIFSIVKNNLPDNTTNKFLNSLAVSIYVLIFYHSTVEPLQFPLAKAVGFKSKQICANIYYNYKNKNFQEFNMTFFGICLK